MHEQSQNYWCKWLLENCKKVKSLDLTFKELEDVIDSFKNGECRDTLGFIRDIFKRGGKSLFLSLLNMMNMSKWVKVFPKDSFKMTLPSTLKKKNGSIKDLNNYRGIFIVPFLSLIFERLLKTGLPHILRIA